MTKRLLGWFVGSLFAVLSVCTINWYQTKKSLVSFCRETPAGTPLAHVEESARQHGFRFINYSSADHEAFVTAGGVMGRYVCIVEHDGKRVVKTSLSFND